MCGRYVLSMRPSQVRQRLYEENMPAYEWPDDDDPTVRQSYNFAPGQHGLVYRADVPDSGATKHNEGGESSPAKSPAKGHSKKSNVTGTEDLDTSNNGAAQVNGTDNDEVDGRATKETKYRLQAMKWGLIPFWTKRSPDYGSMMKTINARDDTIAHGGMWTTMRQRKRCVVVAEGFYEWQKKNGGKDKIPHFIKRKDGQMMCFAGLWDCVKYEDAQDKLYTYTIITTDSNKQLGWLHDRMPVILEPGSEQMTTWLDPARAEWTKELQSILKPWDGELEVYPVDKAVGKVGNNSPTFVVPINSLENKNNIANFFGNQAKKQQEVKKEEEAEDPESNAPLPKPEEVEDVEEKPKLKREVPDDSQSQDSPQKKIPKLEADDKVKKSSTPLSTARKLRSSTNNHTVAKSPVKGGDGSSKITSFFGK